MEKHQISAVKRLVAMLLDLVIMSLIVLPFFMASLLAISADILIYNHGSNHSYTEFLNYFSLLGIALFFCKDILNGRSPAKRLLNLQVVDNLTGQVASPSKCVIRNLLVVVWKIEPIIILFNPSRRLGDRIAGTKIVVYEPGHDAEALFNKKGISTFFTVYGVLILLMYFLNLAF